MNKVMINYNRGLEHYIDKYAMTVKRGKGAKKTSMNDSLRKISVHTAHVMGCIDPFIIGGNGPGMVQKNICQEGQG